MAITVTQTGAFAINADGLGRVRGGAGSAIVFSASGGTAPYRFEVTCGALPAGVVLGTDGVIKPQALARGSASVTIRVTDSGKPPQHVDSSQTVTVS